MLRCVELCCAMLSDADVYVFMWICAGWGGSTRWYMWRWSMVVVPNIMLIDANICRYMLIADWCWCVLHSAMFCWLWLIATEVYVLRIDWLVWSYAACRVTMHGAGRCGLLLIGQYYCWLRLSYVDWRLLLRYAALCELRRNVADWWLILVHVECCGLLAIDSDCRCLRNQDCCEYSRLVEDCYWCMTDTMVCWLLLHNYDCSCVMRIDAWCWVGLIGYDVCWVTYIYADLRIMLMHTHWCWVMLVDAG